MHRAVRSCDCQDRVSSSARGETHRDALAEQRVQRVQRHAVWADDGAPANFGLDTPGARGPTVKTTFTLPISHRDAGEQNGYRVVPWHSILGESTTYPVETFHPQRTGAEWARTLGKRNKWTHAPVRGPRGFQRAELERDVVPKGRLRGLHRSL